MGKVVEVNGVEVGQVREIITGWASWIKVTPFLQPEEYVCVVAFKKTEEEAKQACIDAARAEWERLNKAFGKVEVIDILFGQGDTMITPKIGNKRELIIEVSKPAAPGVVGAIDNSIEKEAMLYLTFHNIESLNVLFDAIIWLKREYYATQDADAAYAAYYTGEEIK